MTWFSPRMVLFVIRTTSDIIWGNEPPKTKKEWRCNIMSPEVKNDVGAKVAVPW